MEEIYNNILSSKELNHKMLAVLLDPDQCRGRILSQTIAVLKSTPPDYIFVGGSHTVTSIDSFIDILKDEVATKIVLFPGNASQFSTKADALLYLSLISGRNSEFLIGQHITSALAIKQSGIETISTGYILIDGGKPSSVEYISSTRPIPRDKKEIVLSTAVAGELLGLKMVYLEAGSGANFPVPRELIKYISAEVALPLLVGGGIRTTQQLTDAYNAGADLVVVGNVFESEPEKMAQFIACARNFDKLENVAIDFTYPKHQDIL
jgi:putative glycerol-1-phosphate prenyltransferase